MTGIPGAGVSIRLAGIAAEVERTTERRVVNARLYRLLGQSPAGRGLYKP